MYYSKSFIPTTKETPKEATLPSHIFLSRGGFITQVSAGIYDYLPLGKKVLDNISAIVKEELDKAGCIEVSLGFVTPCEMWEASHRLEKYGKELLRFKDRKNNCFVLGPTHEEMMVDLVKNRVTSYKQLPLNLYQINLKFRDEARPRFGLMRGREFLMKDGYSFHENSEDMKREFDLMEATYKKIFTRLGLEFRVVEADSGAIGGTGSKEFMVLAHSGEDTIVVCNRCEYAANVEAARRRPESYFRQTQWGEDIQTALNALTISDVCEDINSKYEIFTDKKVEPIDCVKAVAKRALYDDRNEIVLFFIRGSDELEETKAANAIHANELVDVSEEELKEIGLIPRFMGPMVGKSEVSCKYVIDQELKHEKYLVVGANKEGFHAVMNINEQQVRGENFVGFCDLTVVHEGDTCVCCGGKLGHTKGIEVGHIFQLGTRYSDPLDAKFLDRNGKATPFVMGTYGIGVSRLVAAVVEQRHDDKGCIWPLSIAPYGCMIIVSNVKDETQMEFATTLYTIFSAKGVRVLFDDRDERYGVKMADFELIGIPFGVVIGKNLAEGNVEIVVRDGLEKTVVDASSVMTILKEKMGVK